MKLGFCTLKDILEVVIIPVALFAVGALLPRMFEAAKKRRFLALIRRELGEMAPRLETKTKDGRWHQHLNKAFIHEEILKEISENRDFPVIASRCGLQYEAVVDPLWQGNQVSGA